VSILGIKKKEGGGRKKSEKKRGNEKSRGGFETRPPYQKKGGERRKEAISLLKGRKGPNLAKTLGSATGEGDTSLPKGTNQTPGGNKVRVCWEKGRIAKARLDISEQRNGKTRKKPKKRGRRVSERDNLDLGTKGNQGRPGTQRGTGNSSMGRGGAH